MDTNKTPPGRPAGMKKPRLTAMERLAMETGLNAGKTPYAIAQELGRPPKTVMREIRGQAVESDKGAVGRVSNRCARRYECTRRDVCKACYQRRGMQCKFCRQCNSHCPDYIEDRCARLESSPFVCNGCKDRNRCTLRKRFYRNGPATENYREVLVESRRGANVTEAELLRFDALLHRLTKNGQSVHAVVVNNPELFTVSEKTLYRYIDGRLLSTKNGDLPRKCSLKPRKGKGAGLAMMTELFFIIVTDNGIEFTLPGEIEKDCEGNKVANLFYANPGASYQKPHVERNHEFIRLVLPKGSHYFLPTSFDSLTQDDVDLMMSHINSYVREASGDKPPYDLMTRKFGVEFAELFNIRRIPANDVVLKPSLLGIEQKVRPEILKATDPENNTK